MMILKQGKIFLFHCNMCESEFIAGINAANTPDNGENYYCHCPVCGHECHTDWTEQNELARSTVEKGGNMR